MSVALGSVENRNSCSALLLGSMGRKFGKPVPGTQVSDLGHFTLLRPPMRSSTDQHRLVLRSHAAQGIV
jgi:hypothetical protein